MTEMSNLSLPSPRRIAVWNTFLDRRYPQHDRLDSFEETLQAAGPFDAVGLIEIQDDHGSHLAHHLSDTDGFWSEHSRKSLGEHIGVFGPEITLVDEVKLGHRKTAVIARLGDVALAITHLRKPSQYFPPTPEQVDQIAVLLEYLSDEEKAIILGDFNCLWFQLPRRMIEAAGYESAFRQLGKSRHGTLPANREFIEMYNWRQRLGFLLAGGAINLDDAYVKGVTVLDASYFKGESDHKGVWVEYEDE